MTRRRTTHLRLLPTGPARAPRPPEPKAWSAAQLYEDLNQIEQVLSAHEECMEDLFEGTLADMTDALDGVREALAKVRAETVALGFQLNELHWVTDERE